MIKIKLKIIIILACLLSSGYVGAITPDMDDHPAWWWFVHPELPATGNCRGTIFQNITPSEGADNVNIGINGVQICANITPPANCYINVTYQWLNYTAFYDDWLDWVNTQPWGNWGDYEDWWDDIDWDNKTDCYDDTFWHNFTSTVTISQFTKLCSYNDNVSCKIENDYTTTWFDWRINWEMNCSGVITSGKCYYYFEPEECPVIKYIYPPSPNGTVCPCCDNICLGVENTDGHPMNISIYGSTDNEHFFTWNKYHNVTNDTFCFCMDTVYLEPTADPKGEWISASGIQAPGLKPASMEKLGCSGVWEFTDGQEETISFSVRAPSKINLTYPTNIDIGWSSPAQTKLCNWNLSYSITALDEDTSIACEYYQDVLATSSATANGLTMYTFPITEISDGDRCLHLTIERDGNDATDTLSDDAHLHGICFRSYVDYDLVHVPQAISPMQYNQTYYWYANITDTTTGAYVVSDTFQFKTFPNPSYCPCGPEDLAELIDDTDTVKDDSWIVGTVIIFSVFGIVAYVRRRKR